MTQLMVGISGVRGVVGEALTPEVILEYALAFGTWARRGKVVVGRDSRTTGPMVRHTVLAGLLSTGCSVVDLGIVSTPTVEIITRALEASGGICITSSHNPAQWNALKFLNAEGMFFNREEIQAFLKQVAAQKPERTPWDQYGTVEKMTDASERHIQRILGLKVVDPDLIRSMHFTVALDCVNGAGGLVAPRLLEALGCSVIPLNVEPTGIFAHNPEPRAEHLADLCQAVKAGRARVGFACDPDVDRLGLVDEKGAALSEELTLALAVQLILRHTPGPVTINLSTSLVTEEVARQAGCPVYREPVGEINVTTAMKQNRSVVGGEGNGGIILPENHLGRDALLGMALILQALAETGKNLSQLVKALPPYHLIKKSQSITGLDTDAVFSRFREKYADAGLDERDGLRFAWKDRWLQVRKSNTEPIVRITGEAPSQPEAEALLEQAVNLIKLKGYQL
jgi:phosphomannomutase